MEILAEASKATKRFGAFTAVSAADLAVGRRRGRRPARGEWRRQDNPHPPAARPAAAQRRRRPALRLPPSIATRRRVGYVPQTLGLYAGLTVAENWSLHGRGVRQLRRPDARGHLRVEKRAGRQDFRSARNDRSRSRSPSPTSQSS